MTNKFQSEWIAWPRGLNRVQAANYLGISSSTFQRLVDTKAIPRGKRITKGRLVWDRVELDHYFDHIDNDEKKEDSGHGKLIYNL